MSETPRDLAQVPGYCWLEDRAALAVSGTDARSFLQGIVSSDTENVTPNQAVWSAFLTPQGKYLHDFFMVAEGERLLLDTEVARLPDLLKRLRIYKLRSAVQLEDLSGAWRVAAAWGPGAAAALDLEERAGAAAAREGGLAFVDPRHPGMGVRLLLPAGAEPPPLPERDRAEWESLRIGLGLPDGSRDMEVEKAILLENGFDELGGVDWKKGCYMGQELTARTKYRGLVKKRLLPIALEEAVPEDAEVVEQAGRQVGELRSRSGSLALALLRLEALERDLPLTVAGRPARVMPPDWVVLPQPRAAAS